jgi:rhodanese-related sulfurtransferase
VSTGVFENSLLIPLPELKKRVEEARDKPNILVNCRTGIRARFAYSILANAGIEATVLADSTYYFI